MHFVKALRRVTLVAAFIAIALPARAETPRAPVDSSQAPDGEPGYGPPPEESPYRTFGRRPSVPKLVEGWFKPLPMQRLLDLEVGTGFPDGIGLCLEANPSPYFSLAACGGTFAFISSLSLDVKSRFLQYQSFTVRDDHVEGGYLIGVGPGFGFAVVNERLASDPVRPSSIFLSFPAFEGLLSFEWAYWWSTYVGLSIQADMGLAWPVFPIARLSLGLTFGMPPFRASPWAPVE